MTNCRHFVWLANILFLLLLVMLMTQKIIQQILIIFRLLVLHYDESFLSGVRLQRIGFRFFNKVLTLMVYLELTKDPVFIVKGRILSLFRIIIFIKLPNLKMPLSLTYFFLKLYMAFKFVFGVVFKMIMLHCSCT